MALTTSYDARVSHPPPLQRREPAHRIRYPPLFAGLPLVVWALCAVFVATMLMWSVVKGTYDSSDERQHVAAGLYWSEYHEWPRFKEMGMMLNVMRSDDLVHSVPHEAAAAPARPERPSFADLTRETPVSEKSRNQMSQHPPLYYVMLGQLHDVLPVDMAADLEVWIMRLMSIVLMAPLPLLAAALARRLGASRPNVIIVAAATALIPGIASIGGAVNNDNLLNAASGWVLLGIASVLTGDLRSMTAAWIGAALAVALLTKAFAIPIAVGVALAYVVAIVRFRSFRSGLASLAIVVGVAALGGWWWLQNLVRYGTLQPAGHRAALADGPLTILEALPLYADRFTRVFFSRFWAGMDPRGFDHPGFWISASASILVLGILFVGLAFRRRAMPRGAIVDFAVLLTPFLLALVILLYSTYRITMNTGFAAGIQGRYLYCVVIGAIVVTVFALAALLPTQWHPVVMIAVTLTGLAFTTWRVADALGNAWAPSEQGIVAHFEALFAWSPLPYAASVGLFVFFVVAAITAAALVVREYVVLRRPKATTGSPDDGGALRGAADDAAGRAPEREEIGLTPGR